MALSVEPGGFPETGRLLLAVETSAKDGSTALGSWKPDGSMAILAEAGIRADEEQASVLVPRIQELLAGAGRTVDDLGGVVVGAGPGSFTGVRIGASTAKGLAWAQGLEFWALSSLLGAAMASSDEPLRPRMVLFDARGDRLYAAAYRETGAGVEVLVEPTPTTVGEVLDGMVPPGAVLMGDGAHRHRDILQGLGNPIMAPPAGRPHAKGLLRALSLEPDTGPVADIGGWNPDYLRVSGAERLWSPSKP